MNLSIKLLLRAYQTLLTKYIAFDGRKENYMLLKFCTRPSFPISCGEAPANWQVGSPRAPPVQPVA